MIINLQVVSIVTFVDYIFFFSSSIVHCVQFIFRYASFCCIQSEDLLLLLSTFISSFFTEQFGYEIMCSTLEVYAEVYKLECGRQQQISHGLPQAYQEKTKAICVIINDLFFSRTNFFLSAPNYIISSLSFEL
jgi:hypothetical protein